MRLFCTLLLFFLTVSPVFGDIWNPNPDTDDLVLPMPGGGSMAFRPVFIGEGDKPFAMKQFKVGNRAGGKNAFKEFPTEVLVGGSFIGKNPGGQPEWLYYIGKYEVTEAQYQAVMNPNAADKSRKPMSNISWFDAQDFLKKYNLWLFENAREKLPKNKEAIGFLRLPTEIEWEFAARGGCEVGATEFDKKHPYPGKLTQYEWFEGPKSSHGKKKKIGMLKPNALKLYDMLGNISEMTGELYRIEYNQGRIGGFVSRGGNYLTSENRIRSSLRGEIPLYKEVKGKITPSKQSVLGFRLLISSQIYVNRNTFAELDKAWEEYTKTSRNVPGTQTAAAGLPTSSQTDVQLADALNVLTRLYEDLKKMPDLPAGIDEKIGLLNASFKNIESTVNKAAHDFAFAWVKITTNAAYTVQTRDMAEMEGKQKALEIAKNLGKSRMVEDIENQIRVKTENIKEGLESYGFGFMQLEKIEKSTVEKGFEKCKNFLVRRNAAPQIRMLALVKKHYLSYLKDRRLNIDLWKADLEKF